MWRKCNAAETPVSPGARLDAKTGVRTNKSEKRYRYKELIGSLMYLVTCTRPDITHTVSIVAQFNDSPHDHHWGAAKKVLKYLKGASELSLHYHRLMGKLIAYSDSSYATTVKTKKHTRVMNSYWLEQPSTGARRSRRRQRCQRRKRSTWH